MSPEQIKHMVSRFLGWRLPDNFRPDCGIHFDPDAAKKLNPRNLRYEPNGTNLFSADQAEAMIRHLIEGLPPSGREERLDLIGAAEAQVGRYVYRRIEVLMDTAAPGSPEAAELDYLSTIAANVEEYGEEACGGFGLVSKDQAAALAARHPISSEDDNSRAAAEKGPFTPQEREALLQKLHGLAAAAETMSPEEARAVLAASEDDNVGGADTVRAGPDATDLFEAFEAALVEGSPTLSLQSGRIWIDGETAFDARRLVAALSAAPTPTQEGKEGRSSSASLPAHVACATATEAQRYPELEEPWPLPPGAPTYKDALAVVHHYRRGSTSLVQRKLQIGYNKACGFIEQMERDGIIGRPNYAGFRQYLGEAKSSEVQPSSPSVASAGNPSRDEPSSPTQEGADDNAGAGDTGGRG
jgi:hypothetical protein